MNVKLSKAELRTIDEALYELGYREALANGRAHDGDYLFNRKELRLARRLGKEASGDKAGRLS